MKMNHAALPNPIDIKLKTFRVVKKSGREYKEYSWDKPSIGIDPFLRGA